MPVIPEIIALTCNKADILYYNIILRRRCYLCLPLSCLQPCICLINSDKEIAVCFQIIYFMFCREVRRLMLGDCVEFRFQIAVCLAIKTEESFVAILYNFRTRSSIRHFDYFLF